MKIFNVSIQVSISQIGEIADREPEPKPFNDDPVDKQAQVMDKYLGKLVRMMPPSFGPSGADGQSMNESVKIVADSFEDVQAILGRFHKLAGDLPAAPASVVEQAMNPPILGLG